MKDLPRFIDNWKYFCDFYQTFEIVLPDTGKSCTYCIEKYVQLQSFLGLSMVYTLRLEH